MSESKKLARSEPLKRRSVRPLRFIEDDTVGEHALHYLVSFVDSPDHAVVDQKRILVDADGVMCSVKDRGKWHRASIVKKGTQIT